MDSVYTWDRSDKLFAIRCLRLSEPTHRERIVKQLIVDDDPVVRGKTALAMKSCSDEILLECAETLLEQEEPNTSILAMELLGFTNSTDFSDHLETPLNSDDERVVKSAIETLHLLPDDPAISLIEEIITRYDDALKKPLFRTLEKINTPQILPSLKNLYEKVADEDKPEVLRIGASLESKKASKWLDQAIDEHDLTENQIQALRWLQSTRS